MYCGQCGKKVLETMLFCPFCGSPIVIPDQDETAREAPAPLPPEPVQEEQLPLRPVSLFDGYEPLEESEPEPIREEETFTPLVFDIEEEAAPAAETSAQEPPAEETPAAEEEKAPQRPSAQTRRPANSQNRQANTYIPVKEIAPDDIFMDDVDHDGDAYDQEDDYDVPNDRRSRYDEDFEDDFEFEERERGSFFQRHIRGIVGLLLLLVMLIICAIWAFSPKGQLSLAKMNLAWSADAYADLGYEAYMQKSSLMAARYYEKASALDAANYEYAHSAMVAYYDADETESAAAMLKKCIELDPDNPEPYQEMLILYPDKAQRPWEISELVRLGYQRTGDESLNPN